MSHLQYNVLCYSSFYQMINQIVFEATLSSSLCLKAGSLHLQNGFVCFQKCYDNRDSVCSSTIYSNENFDYSHCN